MTEIFCFMANPHEFEGIGGPDTGGLRQLAP